MDSPADVCLKDYAKRHWLPLPDFDRVLGKGSYGTAYATSDPQQAVKMTSDPDEALLMAMQQQKAYPGIVPCYGALHVVREHWFLWKKALDKVGYAAWLSKFDQDELLETDPATNWVTLLNWIHAHDRDKLPARNAAIRRLERFAEDFPPLRDICHTCITMLDTYGRVPFDMHLNNFGCWEDYNQLIVFDAQMTGFEGLITYESCSR